MRLWQFLSLLSQKRHAYLQSFHKHPDVSDYRLDIASYFCLEVQQGHRIFVISSPMLDLLVLNLTYFIFNAKNNIKYKSFITQSSLRVILEGDFLSPFKTN